MRQPVVITLINMQQLAIRPVVANNHQVCGLLRDLRNHLFSRFDLTRILFNQLAERMQNSQNQEVAQKNETDPQRVIHMAVIGDPNVGKTQLLVRFTSKEYNDEYEQIVFENQIRLIQYGNTTVNLQLRDTTGEESYNMIRPLTYLRTNVFVILFSVLNRQSFQNALSQWYSDVKNIGVPIIFVGNHIDKRAQSTDHVSLEEASRAVAQLKQTYIECSTEIGLGVEEVFQMAVHRALQVIDAAERKPASLCHLC